MRPVDLLSISLLPAAGRAARIIQGNDDGWAELYVRSFNEALVSAGYDVVLSCPAENKSGTGSSDAEPTARTTPCQYNSCPANSGPVGNNATNPRLNWVNSYPVTAIKYGIDTFGPQFWDGQPPELAVSGPNVGSNIWLQVPFSGTVGAAVYAVHEEGIPAIAFSGESGGTLAFDTQPVPARSTVYAQLATKLTAAVLAGGTPYLPDGVWLNVNFPSVEGSCTRAEDFKFVLTRINPWLFSAPDVQHCGTDRLPTEFDVSTRSDGCWVTVSVGDAADKTTADRDRQAAVLAKLEGVFSCLP